MADELSDVPHLWGGRVPEDETDQQHLNLFGRS